MEEGRAVVAAEVVHRIELPVAPDAYEFRTTDGRVALIVTVSGEVFDEVRLPWFLRLVRQAVEAVEERPRPTLHVVRESESPDERVCASVSGSRLA